MIKNLGDALNSITNKKIVAKMISYFYQTDSEYGKHVAQYVEIDRQQLESLLSSK